MLLLLHFNDNYFSEIFSSKRDQPLTSREKLSLCQSVSESLITGGKSGTDAQKLIGIGMETLLVLIDDQDPDVRMSADEALNRVIRVCIYFYILSDHN